MLWAWIRRQVSGISPAFLQRNLSYTEMSHTFFEPQLRQVVPSVVSEYNQPARFKQPRESNSQGRHPAYENHSTAGVWRAFNHKMVPAAKRWHSSVTEYNDNNDHQCRLAQHFRHLVWNIIIIIIIKKKVKWDKILKKKVQKIKKKMKLKLESENTKSSYKYEHFKSFLKRKIPLRFNTWMITVPRDREDKSEWTNNRLHSKFFRVSTKQTDNYYDIKTQNGRDTSVWNPSWCLSGFLYQFAVNKHFVLVVTERGS